MARYCDLVEASANGLDKEDKKYSVLKNLTPSQLADYWMCDAARIGVEKIDNFVKSKSDGGSTVCSVFILIKEDKSMRIFSSWVGDSKCIMQKYDAEHQTWTSVLMSEDHKPSLPRERIRIEKRRKPDITIKPIDANQKTFRDEDIDYSEHSMAILSTEAPKTDAPDMEDGNQWPALEENSSYRIQHEESFIGQRVLPHKPNDPGPMAVCSRYGVSLNMSRSLGDRYGPRSCTAHPDICAATIYPEQYARLMFGSDGVWDVITPEKAEEVCSKYEVPLDAARELAIVARQLRESNDMRIDDITAVVVDIFPQNFQLRRVSAVAGEGGCNCVVS